MGTLGLDLESPQFIRNDESQRIRGRQPVLVASSVPCALQGLHQGTAGGRVGVGDQRGMERRALFSAPT